MHITEYKIKNIDQVSVGDSVVVVTRRGRSVSTARATVTRKLKTKFEVQYADATKVEYSTRIQFGSVTPYGNSSYTGDTEMYPAIDAVLAWCAHEARKSGADKLRWEIADLAQNHRRANTGEVSLLEIAREVATKARRLVEMETEIYKAEHAGGDEAERED